MRRLFRRSLTLPSWWTGPLILVQALLLFPACLPKQPTAPEAFRAALKAAASAPKASLQSTYGKLPLAFEANQGQTDAQVKFLARGQGYSLFLTDTEAVFTLRPETGDRGRRPGNRDNSATLPVPVLPQPPTPDPQPSSVLRMQLVGANPNPHVTGAEELPGKVNYFLGNDPTQWYTNIPTFTKVRYANVYPGVDLIYYGNQRQLEYDFVVAPGADPAAIRLAFAGADELSLDPQGNLALQVAGSTLRFQKPRIYQEAGGVKHEVNGNYALVGPPTTDPQGPTPTIGFQVAAYDPTRPLVIDPILLYSTFLGGGQWDHAAALAVDGRGNAYVAGITRSSDFPTTEGAYDREFNEGGGTNSIASTADAFVAKLNPTGTALLYSTFLGGRDEDAAYAIAVDSAGNAYVAGATDSADYPTTWGAFQTIFHGKAPFTGLGDAFVTKLDPTGSALGYSTFLGGTVADVARAITVDSEGSAYVVGGTGSADFPTTEGAADRTHNGSSDAFVTKLNPAGSALVYSTFLGSDDTEAAYAIAVDRAGFAYVAGGTYSINFPTTPGAYKRVCDGEGDAFVAKFGGMGELIYSTCLGGSDLDYAYGVAVDAVGNAYVTGHTCSASFPTTEGAFQPVRTAVGNRILTGFVTKLDPTGSSLVYSTFLGGTSDVSPRGLALDSEGNAYVAGLTSSLDFPITERGSEQACRVSGEAFVAELDPLGSALLYSTCLGGSNTDIAYGLAVDATGSVYLAGGSGSADFPTTERAYQRTYGGGFYDVFMARLNLGSSPALALSVSHPAFSRGDDLNLMATVATGTSPSTADIYVAVLLPDGSLLFLQGDGSLTGDLRPIVSNWAVSPFTGQIFAYTFSGGEPVGAYAWLAAFTQPGTLNFISPIASAPFSFSP